MSEALKPIIAKTIEDILLGILNKIFHFMPAEYLVAGESIKENEQNFFFNKQNGFFLSI